MTDMFLHSLTQLDIVSDLDHTIQNR